MEYLLYLGALALIAVGLAGTVIPAIPGLPIIFAGSWLIGWASGYEPVSYTHLLRVADAAGVQAVIAPLNRSSHVTPAAAKAAAGAEESVPVVYVCLLYTSRW